MRTTFGRRPRRLRSCSGRRVLVTGISAGVGVETARLLAAHGPRVVGAASDLGKARGGVPHCEDYHVVGFVYV